MLMEDLNGEIHLQTHIEMSIIASCSMEATRQTEVLSK